MTSRKYLSGHGAEHIHNIVRAREDLCKLNDALQGCFGSDGALAPYTDALLSIHRKVEILRCKLGDQEADSRVSFNYRTPTLGETV